MVGTDRRMKGRRRRRVKFRQRQRRQNQGDAGVKRQNDV